MRTQDKEFCTQNGNVHNDYVLKHKVLQSNTENLRQVVTLQLLLTDQCDM
jgi:hypothetical protein